MKVLFIHTMSAFASAGGAEVTLRCLMEALAGAGHECVLLCASKTRGVRHSEREGIRQIEVGLKNLYWPFDGNDRSALARLGWHAADAVNPLMGRIVRDVCQQEKPDVASVHNLTGWSIAAWKALQKEGVPVVQVLHDQYLLCPRGTMFKHDRNCDKQCASCALLRVAHRGSSRHVAAVVGVSRFILDRHESYGYFAGVPVKEVIHDARERAMYQQAPVADDRSRGCRTRFGFIGSITPAKGVQRLVRTFDGLNIDDAELWVAGSLDTKYARDVSQSASSPHIRFLGRVSPSEFFAGIDVLIVPSLWRDTFPGVAMEALIFGKPVIAVNHGGSPEMIRDGYNGLLYDPGSPDGLSSCILRLSGDDELRSALAGGARESGGYYLDTEAWVERYVSTYSRAMAGFTG